MASMLGKTIGWLTGTTSKDGEATDLQEFDPWTWKEHGKYFAGDFSVAVVQATEEVREHSQVEIGSNAIFIGVYDGHGGELASDYINKNLFGHLIRLIQERYPVSRELLRQAIAATENGFMDFTQEQYRTQPTIVRMGSSCLVGIIWGGILHVANLGDSRGVLCRAEGRFKKKLVAHELIRNHSLRNEYVKSEVAQLQPEDATLLLIRNHRWTIKGLVTVSRCIGNADLKLPPFSSDEGFPLDHVVPPINQPLLSAEPEFYTKVLDKSDKFLVFGSNGLWEFLTIEDVVEIIDQNPRWRIAETVIKAAQKVAADRWGTTLTQLTNAGAGAGRDGRDGRLKFHDNMTVIVVFLDHLQRDGKDLQLHSVKPIHVHSVDSDFSKVEELL